MAYGYRENESLKIPEFVKEGKIGYFQTPKGKVEMDETVKLLRLHKTDNKSRPVVAASLGMHVTGAMFPHPDQSDQATAIAGSLYRFGRKVPIQKDLTHFKKFVKKWLEKNLTPLEADCDVSFETWIAGTPYTLARKEELRRKYEELGRKYDLPDKYLEVKSFMKDENYNTFKHARGINSRSDEFKAAVGPFFQLISKRLFALDWFIKKIPINERPQFILDRIERLGELYRTTDYTSFEAHFTKELKESCEYQLYEYMTQFHPEGADWLALVKKSGALKDNLIKFKTFTMSVNAKRMSGEMDTSLGNGFSNLMMMLYICECNGNENITGVVEGDDGLFVMKGEPPAQELFERFGLTIKILDFAELNHASFCGMVFDMQDRTNVTDPISELVTFGWTTARYARSSSKVHMHLLRSKALSLAYQYPGCPILSKLASKVCQLTAGYDVKGFLMKQGSAAFCMYEMEMVQKATEYFDKNGLGGEPKINTRMLVEELYGIAISDQIAIENYIDSMTKIGPVDCPEAMQYMDRDWTDYWEQYTIEYPYQADFDNQLTAWVAVRPQAEFTAERRGR
jgi:hypothetical protein